MSLEIRRQIGDADLAVAKFGAVPQWQWPNRQLIIEIVFRALQVQRRIVTDSKQRERRDARLAVADLDRKLADEPGGPLPVAGGKRGIHPTERVGMIAGDGERLVVARKRLLV